MEPAQWQAWHADRLAPLFRAAGISPAPGMWAEDDNESYYNFDHASEDDLSFEEMDY